jgi:hypothetical protein
MLVEDIAQLMAMIAREQIETKEDTTVKGGAFDGFNESPFGYLRGEGTDAASLEPIWVVDKERPKYDQIFQSLDPIDGKITGPKVKSVMVKSKLPNRVLAKIWKLSDIDRDGRLDSDEFALAMHLMHCKLEGHHLPLLLPQHLIPPSKRS